ncbi:hypothetical protein RGQ13_07740 [Thalassotalea psychrophila]|uniref:Uncharacterized protein n=1 Tax=Thalassotalea psychrophila TaxID=3065647 RepID=A0ABY9TZS1_9GAMM|nr:hypothetical protein RGQ13_07740 [Colwelliaceae bacterium SQ149]
MKQITLLLLSILVCEPANASNLKSDEMCQQYITGLVTDIHLAETVGLQALRVAVNRIADTHPQYHEMANQVAFGKALDDDGHRRVGQHINYMCTQDGTELIDLTYKILLTESIRLKK